MSLRQGTDHRVGKRSTISQRMTSPVLRDSWSKKAEYQQLSGPGLIKLSMNNPGGPPLGGLLLSHALYCSDIAPDLV